ncbi:hypothetical protein JXQ31_17675 [candidate division KSB1 bacterium]|nr:hypothetical protein [candidate division KSB1 bacterium]
MYRKFFYVALALLFFVFISGCGKSSDQEKLEKASEKMGEAGKKMAENMGEGVESMAEAMKEMGEALGGDSKIEPVDFRELKALLPDKLDDLNQTSATGEKTSAFGINVSEAEADYENEGRSVNIKIMDMASMKKMVMMAQFGWMMADFDRETDSGYEKTMTFKGYKGYEKYDTESQWGEINLFVAERFVVEVNGSNVKMDDIKNALDKLDLKKLEGLKN